MSRPKGRNQGCCSADFLKQVLFIFNVLFLLAGFAVLATALWIFYDKYEYVTLLSTQTYPIITYFLLFAGALVLIISIVGFCAVAKNNRPLLLCYSFSLLLIFLIEAMVGVLAFVYRDQVNTELQMNLNNTFMESYKYDEDRTEAIDFLQEKFNCCGAVSFSDWKYSRWFQENPLEENMVPDSCCKTVTENCGRRDHPSNINYSGCLHKMEDHLKNNLSLLCGVGLGICVIQIFGMIYGFQLYMRLKDFRPIPKR